VKGVTEAWNMAGAFFGVAPVLEIVNAQNRSKAYQRGA
jgi:hypothetical protein